MARKRPTISGLGQDVDELKSKVDNLGDSFGSLKGDFQKVERTIDALNKKFYLLCKMRLIQQQILHQQSTK